MAQIVVLKRAHYFSLDNDIIDVHAPSIGALGVAVYAVLARYANRTTGECWPAIDRIAQALDLARSTVKVYLRKLEAAGLIAITRRWDTAGDPTSHCYTLLDPSPVAVDQWLAVRAAALSGDAVSTIPAPEGRRPPAAYKPSVLEHKEENHRSNRNGIQFRYNSFPIKQLRRLAHFVLFWQDGGIHSHYP